MKTRGIRNNNPGNLKELPGDTTVWVGERATDDDPIFEEFETPEDGIRAMGRILTNYFWRHQIYTVRGIVTRWAPGKDGNPTQAYIDFIVDYYNNEPGISTKITETTPFPVLQRLPILVRAIIKFENGVQPYSDETIAAGLARV